LDALEQNFSKQTQQIQDTLRSGTKFRGKLSRWQAITVNSRLLMPFLEHFRNDWIQ